MKNEIKNGSAPRMSVNRSNNDFAYFLFAESSNYMILPNLTNRCVLLATHTDFDQLSLHINLSLLLCLNWNKEPPTPTPRTPPPPKKKKKKKKKKQAKTIEPRHEPVLGGCDQVGLKPARSATETS